MEPLENAKAPLAQFGRLWCDLCRRRLVPNMARSAFYEKRKANAAGRQQVGLGDLQVASRRGRSSESCVGRGCSTRRTDMQVHRSSRSMQALLTTRWPMRPRPASSRMLRMIGRMHGTVGGEQQLVGDGDQAAHGQLT